jgi:hypothetical protein
LQEAGVFLVKVPAKGEAHQNQAPISHYEKDTWFNHTKPSRGDLGNFPGAFSTVTGWE